MRNLGFTNAAWNNSGASSRGEYFNGDRSGFRSGTFGAFASPLSDNTVTLCTILELDVIEYARLKLKPALIAAGITTVLFAVASLILQ